MNSYNIGKNNPMYGKKHSTQTRMKMRSLQLGEKNSCWRGDKIKSTSSLHTWVRKYLPQPELCQECNKKKSYDLANITGIYNREFKNWKYLCRGCHMKSDGRIYNLKHQRSVV